MKTEAGFDYSSAIDPALQGADLSSGAGTPVSQYQQVRIDSADQAAADRSQQSKGGTHSLFSPLSPLPRPEGYRQLEEDTATHKSFPAKKMKVSELIALGGAIPPTPSSPPSASTLSEITKLYNELYVRGLTLFFESKWYEFKETQTGNPDSAPILHNRQLVALFTSFITNISDIKSTNPADMVYSSHLETCVVWSLASLPSSEPQDTPTRPPNEAPAEDDLIETRNRVHVFETLLSGGTLSSNPLSPSTVACISAGRRSELEFWYQLAQYLLSTHASRSPADVSARENSLGLMRSLLDGRENRDVLYSIAVLREYTAQWDATLNEQTRPSHLDESDPRSKLVVATRFIRDESAFSGGTTNVVRRFADLAYWAFVRPGVNVNTSGRIA